MTFIPQLPAFNRCVIQIGRMLIESTCIRCGAKIVGSIADTLQEDEAEHIAECRGFEHAA